MESYTLAMLCISVAIVSIVGGLVLYMSMRSLPYERNITHQGHN